MFIIYRRAVFPRQTGSATTSRGWRRRGWPGSRCSSWSRWPTSSSGARSSSSPSSTGTGTGWTRRNPGHMMYVFYTLCMNITWQKWRIQFMDPTMTWHIHIYTRHEKYLNVLKYIQNQRHSWKVRALYQENSENWELSGFKWKCHTMMKYFNIVRIVDSNCVQN